ncbi:hypothetical protein E5K00_07435 [Hymenobacter aquaticus]|uniref:Outer membrane protein beta-barrel domain-containing protein n=1 Tax=Hymenobacter aquaticus TaxID=1867101 RepID=A0A4Z0Q8J2_9BACT|nr:hypothetical protein [Hymenobacter aquaticus]TGE25022.1 hypothetical protein E5K00_07435 [Hymenobacter aquaticus]
MRHVFLSAGLLLATTLTRAQSFEPGLLVTTANDTLRGEIENSHWVETPATVRFRTAPGAAVATYAPPQLRLFRLTGGRYFRSELLPVDRTAETRATYLTLDKAPRQRPETIFAEVIVEGPAPLLRLATPGATHYFVRRETQGYIELTERRVVRQDQQGRRTAIDANNYRSQLTVFFASCPAATQAVATAKFTAPDLAAVVQAYNQSCANAPQAGTSFLPTTKRRHHVALNAGVLVGVQINSFVLRRDDFRPAQDYSLDGLNVNSRFHPIGGLYADVLFASRQLALHGDLTVNTMGKSGEIPARGALPAGEYAWRGLSYTARLGGRYFVPLGQTSRRLFVGLGLALDHIQVTSTSLRYGSGQPVPVGGGRTVPSAGTFVDVNPGNNSFRGLNDFGGSLPYLEVGLRQGRLTATLDVRARYETSFHDEVAFGLLTANTTTGFPERVSYDARYWLFNATVGYRLSTADERAGR